MLIGSHVPFSSAQMLVSSVKEAIAEDASTLMIYTGAPQNTRRSKLNLPKIAEGKELMAKHHLSKMVVHAPYIVNLANTQKLDTFEFMIEFLREEINRAQVLGAEQITLHPGSHVGAGAKAGMDQIIKGLNEILTKEQTAQIALETMAGKGTEVGRTFAELAYIIDGVKLNDKLSVTFDTCHTNDAGYDIKNDFAGVLKEFDQVIGLDRLKVIHLNDSKNPQGSHKDRHANIGFGTIGFDALNKIAHLSEFAEVPKILETPYVNKRAPYKLEIAMIKAQKFDPELIDKLES